jgi:hypothetical protein
MTKLGGVPFLFKRATIALWNEKILILHSGHVQCFDRSDSATSANLYFFIRTEKVCCCTQAARKRIVPQM